MNKPTAELLSLAKSLNIDVPEGATVAGVRELIRLERVRNRQTAHEMEDLPLEIAERIGGIRMPARMLRSFTLASQMIREAGIRPGSVVRHVSDASHDHRIQICSVMMIDAQRSLLCTIDFSNLFNCVSTFKQDDHVVLGMELVYTPTNGFLPIPCLHPKDRPKSVQSIQRFAAEMRPRLMAHDLYTNQFGEFWRADAVQRLLDETDAAANVTEPEQPYARYCVGCGADGVTRKCTTPGEKHRCIPCRGKHLPTRGRHCVVCRAVFDAKTGNQYRCATCMQNPKPL